MKLTEILRREHEVIKKALEILDEKVGEAGRTGELDTSFMKKFLQFGRGFIEERHQAKEEKCFLQYLEKHGIQRESGPIGVILYEHELGRILMNRMHGAVTKYERGETDMEDVLDRFTEYMELLNQHIYKEENILYPLGDTTLYEEEQRVAYECSKQFDSIENGGYAELVYSHDG
jgi:hemerythrin-like domain-containing protein